MKDKPIWICEEEKGGEEHSAAAVSQEGAGLLRATQWDAVGRGTLGVAGTELGSDADAPSCSRKISDQGLRRTPCHLQLCKTLHTASLTEALIPTGNSSELFGIILTTNIIII